LARRSLRSRGARLRSAQPPALASLRSAPAGGCPPPRRV